MIWDVIGRENGKNGSELSSTRSRDVRMHIVPYTEAKSWLKQKKEKGLLPAEHWQEPFLFV